jgi:hypothetical protein
VRQEVIAQVGHRKPRVARGPGLAASEKIILLLEPQVQGSLSIGIISDLSEVVEPLLDLPAPSAGWVGP